MMTSSIQTPAQATLSDAPDKDVPFCGMYVAGKARSRQQTQLTRLAGVDVADSFPVTRVRGATCSIARSPVFAPRHEDLTTSNSHAESHTHIKVLFFLFVF